MGKYSNIINIISKEKVVFNMRTFNLILLGILFIIAFKLYKNDSLLFLPLLLCSQVWYIFCYINNDAWAIFLNFILVYQLFYKKSIYNKWIETSKNAIAPIVLGILLCLLLICKENFIIATGIIFITYFILNRKEIFKKENIKKIAIVLLFGISLFLSRIALDISINNFDRFNMEEIRISKATEQFRPPYNKNTYGSFKFKDRGYPLSKVLFDKEFYKISIESFIGLYGRLNVYLPNNLYIFLEILILLILIYLLFRINKLEEKIDIITTRSATIIGIIFLFTLSIYRSYTYDYQPQGRYLLPILPILSLLMIDKKDDKITKIIFIILSIILIISYYLFGYKKII